MQKCHRSTYNLNYSKIWSKNFNKPACSCTNISTVHMAILPGQRGHNPGPLRAIIGGQPKT